MKNAQRLDYAGLAEVLGQRELVEIERLNLALQTGMQGSSPFPELLVADKLMGDWELSRIVCELYSLPFVPVDIYSPASEALEGVGCESCHGPGAEHVKAPGPGTMRREMVGCDRCHEAKFDPAFSLERSLPFASCQGEPGAPTSSRRFSMARFAFSTRTLVLSLRLKLFGVRLTGTTCRASCSSTRWTRSVLISSIALK